MAPVDSAIHVGPLGPEILRNAEQWFQSRVGAGLDGPFLAVRMALFAVVGIVFLVARIPYEIGTLARFGTAEASVVVAGTPAADLPTESVLAAPDATYRRELLDDLLGEVRQALAVRAHYQAEIRRPDAGA